METIGQVIKINKEENTATIAVTRPSACGENCAMCKGCRLTSNTCVVLNEVNAQIGDKVKISINSSKVLLAAFAVYGCPLLLFALTFCIVLSISANTGFAVFGGIIAFFLTFVLVFMLDKKLDKNNKIQSKTIKILN